MFVRSFLLFVISMTCFANLSYAAAYEAKSIHDGANTFFKGNRRMMAYVQMYLLDHPETRVPQDPQASYNAIPVFNLTADADRDRLPEGTASLELTRPSVIEINDYQQFYQEGDLTPFSAQQSFNFASLDVTSVRVTVSKKTNRNIRAYFYRNSVEDGDRVQVKFEEDDEDVSDDMLTNRVREFTFYSLSDDRPIVGIQVFTGDFTLLNVETQIHNSVTSPVSLVRIYK